MVSAVLGALEVLNFGSLFGDILDPQIGSFVDQELSGFLENMTSKSMVELMIYDKMPRAYFRPL